LKLGYSVDTGCIHTIAQPQTGVKREKPRYPVFKQVTNLLKTCSFLLIFVQNARISINFLQISAHFYPISHLKTNKSNKITLFAHATRPHFPKIPQNPLSTPYFSLFSYSLLPPLSASLIFAF